MTKLISAKRTGSDKMIFVCKFSTKVRRNVIWLLNSLSVVASPHFEMNKKYERKTFVFTFVAACKVFSLLLRYYKAL